MSGFAEVRADVVDEQPNTTDEQPTHFHDTQATPRQQRTRAVRWTDEGPHSREKRDNVDGASAAEQLPAAQKDRQLAGGG